MQSVNQALSQVHDELEERKSVSYERLVQFEKKIVDFEKTIKSLHSLVKNTQDNMDSLTMLASLQQEYANIEIST